MNSSDAHVLDDLDAVPEKLKCNSSLFNHRSIGRSGTDYCDLAGKPRQRFPLNNDTPSDGFESGIWKCLDYFFVLVGFSSCRQCNPVFFHERLKDLC